MLYFIIIIPYVDALMDISEKIMNAINATMNTMGFLDA